MQAEVLLTEQGIPFLKNALTLGEIEDFKPRVDKLFESEGIPADYDHEHLELCRSVMYGHDWYRGCFELMNKVAKVFLWWFDKCATLDGVLHQAYKHFYQLGDLNFKFFSHLTVMYEKFIMLRP